MADKREEVPSTEEIAKLPRWARVAFAARCARRVQPLFKFLWRGKVPTECCEAVEKAIRLAECCAGAGRAPPAAAADAAARAARAAAAKAEAARADADRADGVDRDHDADFAASTRAADDAARAVADAAASAAFATASAAYADASAADAATRAAGASDAATDRAAAALDDASAAVAAYADARGADAANRTAAAGKRFRTPPVLRESVVRAIWADLTKLQAAARSGRWTDKTPVPLEFFGALWPEGGPKGWTSIVPREKVFDRDPMALYFDRREFSNEQIAEVISLLSELYGTVSGDRLVIKGTTLFVPKGEPVPEGV